MKYKKYEEKAQQLREEMFEMTVKAKTGHLTSSLSCVEILTTLFYGGIMRYNSQNPDWAGRDYFIMSKAQASPIYYEILADVGYFPKEDLKLFAQAEGKMGVHLQDSVPGCEITAGSLGCGYGIAAGIALALKKNRENNMVFSLLGDGECYEGAIWETALFTAHNRLNNLITIVDRNFICATHFLEDELGMEPIEDKWKAFGFEVNRIDGHSFEQLFGVLENVRSKRNTKPIVIIADTVKGKGIPFIADQPLWHGITVTKEEDVVTARKELTSNRR
ncbi:MAG: transketolase [Lachnospiraceae bacterium]|nr:transketolase [Lachnospiraceae bacterium]